MNDALKLQISAFVDGELPDNETELLLRRLCQCAELRGQVARYLSIGHAIRGDHTLAAMSRLRGRIAAALGEEVVEVEPAPELVPTRFMRPVAGIAVAATVAVMALVGLRQIGPAEQGMNLGFDDLAALAIDEAPAYTEPPADEFMSNRPSDLLSLYYQRHSAKSANFESRLAAVELRGDRLASADEPEDIEDEPDAAADTSRIESSEP